MANKYTPYHEASRIKAKEICEGIKTLPERFEAITKYVSKAFSYDYIRAILITKKNGLPDIDLCWKKHMGVCLDISSMTVGMLRAVSIPCNLVIGWADGKYHAWVEAKIGNKKYLYDHEDLQGKVKTYKRERMY